MQSLLRLQALEANNLTVEIGGKTVCRELDLIARAGECWALLGQNGAGKTTLLRTLAGLHPPRVGRVSWNGMALAAYSRRTFAQQVGILLQGEVGEFWGSVQEYALLGRFPHRNVLLGYGAQDEVLANQALQQVDLAGLADRSLDTLSGGERQRAAIAQLLVQHPECYLLDEPLQHLDLRHQAQVMQIFSKLQAQGGTIMMVLHDPLWAQRCCDHVLMQYPDGRVLHGRSQDLLTRGHLEELYQCPLHEISVAGERCFVAGV